MSETQMELDTTTKDKPARKPRGPNKVTRAVEAAPAVDNSYEIAYWGSVQNSRDPGDFEIYLDKFPGGLFSDLAERRVKQLLQAEVQGGEPELYTAPVKKPAMVMPETPIPQFAENEVPRYLLLADFFGENDVIYARDTELTYYGPPNEHMEPLTPSARRAKDEQKEYLDACWAVKCKAEGRPVVPRPLEMADQIEVEMQRLKTERGGVAAPEFTPPSRPDLALNHRANPNAARIGENRPATGRYADRSPSTAPMLGRDGAAYQREVKPGFGTPLNQ